MENQDYEVRWLIPDQVVLMVQKTNLDVDGLMNMVADVNTLLETSSNSKIPIIVDSSAVKQTNANIGQVVEKFRSVRSDKWGFTVIIGAKGVIQFMAQLVLQLARVEVRMTSTMENALEILYRMHPELPQIE